jgi:transposase
VNFGVKQNDLRKLAFDHLLANGRSEASYEYIQSVYNVSRSFAMRIWNHYKSEGTLK